MHDDNLTERMNLLMDKCEFCSDIMTTEELDKFDNKLWNKDAFGIFNVLAYRNTQGDVDLVTFSYCDDDFYNRVDRMEIKYCPMCGRKLNAD